MKRSTKLRTVFKARPNPVPPGRREHGLVFASAVGTPLDPSHVRREFRKAIRGVPGLDPADWTPPELRQYRTQNVQSHGEREIFAVPAAVRNQKIRPRERLARLHEYASPPGAENARF
jgi:hypothetical protein